MTTLPTGTVTFLFTDIEGSTKLLHQLGAQYARALGEHQALLREAFAAGQALSLEEAIAEALGEAYSSLRFKSQEPRSFQKLMSAHDRI